MPTLVYTASGTWSPPADWPGFATKIECIGAGGLGSARIATTRGGNGGGGGEYAAESGVIYVTGSKTFTIGTSGSGVSTTFPADTVTITAHAAGNATAAAAGNGAGGSGSTNTIRFAGGAGRATPASTASGGGGGGAAGPSGVGSAATSNIGGAADNSTVAAPAAGTAGNSGTEWSTAGCGTGGSGFASGTNNGTAGGQAGGGGSGASDGSAASTGGAAGHGLIAITYTSADLVPSLGSIQVVAYPPPRHLVVASGALFYRQQIGDLPPGAVNVSLAQPLQPTAGVGAFAPNPSAVLAGVAATQPTPPAFTPQIGTIPNQAVTATAGYENLAPSLSQFVSAVVAASDSPPPPLGIEADANFTFTGKQTISGYNSLSAGTGQTPQLIGVAAAAPNIALAGGSIGGPLAAVFPVPIGTPGQLIPAFGMPAAPASLGVAENFTPDPGSLLVAVNAVGYFGQFAPTSTSNTLGQAYTNSAFGLFAGVLNLFPAQSSIQVIAYPVPQFNVLLPGQLYYHSLGEAIPGVAVALSPIQTMGNVGSFTGFALLSGAATQSQPEPFIFSGPLSPGTTMAVANLFQTANFIPATSGIRVLVFPPPRYNVLAPGTLYYRAASTDMLPLTTILLPAAAAFAAVGQIGPALYAPAADPIGVAAPLAVTPPLSAQFTTSVAAPLSLYETGINLAISATGTPGIIGPSALLAGAAGYPGSAPFVSAAVYLTGVGALAQAGPFPTSVTLAAGVGFPGVNSFGLVPPLVAISATGTPGNFILTYLLTHAATTGQPGNFGPQPSITQAAAQSVAEPLVSTFILVPATVQARAEPLSTPGLANIPMGWAISTARSAVIIPSLADTLVGLAATGHAANLGPLDVPQFVAISATGNAAKLTPIATLLGVGATGSEGFFSAAEQVSLIPLAIALGQVGDFGISTAVLPPASARGEVEEFILEIIVVPAQAPFTPVGRGRLVVSTQPNRIRRVLH